MRPIATCLLLLSSCSVTFPAYAADFERDVRPILSQNCFKCHGGPRAKKDFQMDRPEKLLEHIGPGKYIVPGKPEESEIVRRITMAEGDSNRMPPPRKGTPLTQGEVEVIRSWIQEGAHLDANESSPASAPAPQALHSWTSVKGTSLQASFVRLEGTAVILRLASGQEKSIPFEAFSRESQALIQSLAPPEPKDAKPD